MIPETSKGLIWDGAAWVPMDYPWHIQRLPTFSPFVIAGAANFFTATVVGNGSFYNSSAALNDEYYFDVVLAQGTWTLEFWHRKAPTDGIMQPKLDGANVGSAIDCYTAGTTNNNFVSLPGIAVATSGKKRLSFKATGKAAAASGYTIAVQTFNLRRTA